MTTTPFLSDRKSCFRCHETKSLAEFYRHPQTADGHLGKCKLCARAERKEYRRNNPDKIRAELRAASRRAGFKAKATARRLIDLETRPNIERAHNRVSKAIASGKLTAGSCEVCGGSRVDAHHDDYSRPLDVRWLCRAHHQAWHAANGPGAYVTNYDHYT